MTPSKIPIACSVIIALCCPLFGFAQVSGGVQELHQVLSNVYDQMTPLCSQLTDMARALSGIGVLFYIGVRVWKHIARAEPIDFFALFRPLVLTIMIGFFPKVMSTINAILSPTVTATASLVQHSNDAVHNLLALQATELTLGSANPVLIGPNPTGIQPGYDKYAQPDNTSSGSGSIWSAIGDGFKFIASGMISSIRFVFKLLLSIILELLFYAASLCIDTIRTFHLIVLAILGPFVFAFSCYDGFQHSLTHWLARYVNIYLWLPIANIFGAIMNTIQANMLQMDIARQQAGSLQVFSQTDIAYLIFLGMGVAGYFTIPGIANYIIHTHGPNPLAAKVSSFAGAATSMAITAATGVPVNVGGGGGGGNSGGSDSGYEDGKGGSRGEPYQYNRDKIAG